MGELVLENVGVTLGGQSIVEGIGATLMPGRLHVLIGPNGAGKTTLLKTMAALIRADNGTVSLDGEDVARMSYARRAGEIAYLPQDRSIAWDMSGVEIAALGAPHLPAKLARQKAFAELGALGLQEMADRGVFSLSGGQRARVLLARVLVSPARVLLLDEPLTALDPAWQRHVLTRLKQRASDGATVVLSLHDLHLAAQFADEVLLMHQGHLVAQAEPDKVFTPDHLAGVFNLKGKLVGSGVQKTLRLEALPVA